MSAGPSGHPGAPGSVAIGDFEVSLVRSEIYWWDGGAMFGVVPKTLWSRKAEADELNRVALGLNCYCIRTPGKTILIETGGGDKLDARARERAKMPPGHVPLPIDPESVDIVVNSHLHWDHCSGNTILRGESAVPAFPRARYFAPRSEWEHAHERLARDRIAYIDANYDPLVESGRMTLIGEDCEIAPGVWMRRAPGHTRGMTVITAESHGQTFCFLSDLVPTAAHLQPTWVAAFDLDPLESIVSKIRWLNGAAGNWICGFGHDPAIAFARIARDPKTQFRAEPL